MIHLCPVCGEFHEDLGTTTQCPGTPWGQQRPIVDRVLFRGKPIADLTDAELREALAQALERIAALEGVPLLL